jgi:hypothetical protein
MLDDFYVKSVNELFFRKLEVVVVIRVPKLDTTITLANIDELPRYSESHIEEMKSADTNGDPLFQRDDRDNSEIDWTNTAKIRVMSEYSNLFGGRRDTNNQTKPENLVIHIHGGGFISMSSGSH